MATTRLGWRRGALKAVDRIRGARLGSALESVSRLSENSPHAEELRQSALASVLSHALNSTDFYRPFSAVSCLHELPVVNKEIIRDNYDAFVARGVDLSRLEVASTSGSTGTPFRIHQNPEKRSRRDAETIYFGAKAGYFVGDRLFHLKIWSDRNKAHPVLQWARNLRPVDVVKLDDDLAGWLGRELSRGSYPRSVLAYGSALDQLVRIWDRIGPPPDASRVTAVVSQSEAVSDHARERIGEWLGVPVVSRYGIEEVGVIAQQLPGESAYRINLAGTIVEIIRLDDDNPADPGELGRIVVTDLFNYAVPLLRYDTGDLGRFLVLNNGQVDRSTLSEIAGRKLDQIFDTRGRHVSPFVFYKSLWMYPSIRQFQLAQLAEKRFELRLAGHVNSEESARIRQDFLGYLGEDAEFVLRFVDELPLLHSGKRKVVTNEWLSQP